MMPSSYFLPLKIARQVLKIRQPVEANTYHSISTPAERA